MRMAKIIRFFSEIPNTSVDPVHYNDPIPNKIAIDAARRVHMVFVATLFGQQSRSLYYGIGTPGGGLVIFGDPSIFVTKYAWPQQAFYPVVQPAQFVEGRVFDLAVDSKGVAHVCLQGASPVNEGVASPQVNHAVFNAAAGKFDPPDVLEALYAPNDVSIAIAADDSIHIAYTDQIGLHYVTGRAASGFAATTVDADTEISCLNVSIAVNATGAVGISYLYEVRDGQVDAGAVRLGYAQKTASGWRLATPEGGPLNGMDGQVKLYPPVTNSLYLDDEGVPHIAYFYLGRGLQHATLAASGWSNELVDAAGQGTPAKILLDATGALSIAYQAMSANETTELRYASRANSGIWGTPTLDASENCGMWVSGATSSTGLPHIGYNLIQANGSVVVSHAFAEDVSLQVHRLPNQTGPKKPIQKIPQ
jgi:hypothetical protein